MMKKWIFLALLIAGCKHGSGGSSEAPNNEPPEPDDPAELPSYPFNFDHETAGGIQIETRGHSIPSDAEIDGWYTEVNQCVEEKFTDLGITGFKDYEAPPIIIEDDLDTLCNSSSTQGVYCVNYLIPFVAIQTNSANLVNKDVWKHEFIHHILVHNDVEPSDPMNINHKPTELWNCQFN